MQNSSVRVIVENLKEVRTIQGIFQDLVSSGAITVEMAWTASGAVSLAESTLIREPMRAVAVVLNCVSDADAAEFRAPWERILSRASTSKKWHLAVAVPDVVSWATLDPEFAGRIDAENRLIGSPRTVHDIAVSFENWSKQHQFGIQKACIANRELAALNDFIVRNYAVVGAI